jgi:nucleoside-diphosphate-sugar epimerase
MERVLVTGGLGFIGSRLCGALVDAAVAVRCVDDLSGEYAWPGARLAGGGAETGAAAGAALAARGAEVLVAAARPAHVRGVDSVVHLAGLPGVRATRSRAELRAANVELPARLARAAARRGVRFVLVSSSSVYGNAAELPTPEHAPLAPLNPYAESKVAAEAAVLATCADAVIVRPFTVYGPGQRPDMAFARWTRALAAGEPVPWHAAPGTARDFTFVDDAVAGILAALRRGRSGEAYNVSGGRPVELRDALALVAGTPAPRIHDLPASRAEALVTSGCGRKAGTELSYRPRVDLAEGIERQLAATGAGRLAA